MRRRGFLSLAVAVGAAALTEGCVTISPLATSGDFPVDAGFSLNNSTTWSAMKARNNNAGQIVIGVKADQPGLGYYDANTNSYSGFDILIARYVAAGLGFALNQIQFTTIASQDRETELENGSVDLVVASYSYTALRATEVAFAGPYFTTNEALMVRKGDTSITGLSSITSSSRVCDVSNSSKINNVQIANPVVKSTYGECAAAIKNQDADVVYTDYALLIGYEYQDPATFTVIDTGQGEQYYGIGLPHNDLALQSAINTILGKGLQDGTWRAIFNSTLGPEGVKANPPKIGNWGSN